MKWSRRLQTIAEEVVCGAPMADIGTDHAYLPIRLKQEERCPHVILCDVSPGSLKKAGEDWKAALPGEPADLRLGDGLQVLRSGEVKTVVMAGIGGILMAEILEFDPVKTCSFPRYVLQPRSHAGYLRWRLDLMGFTVLRERIAPEGSRMCEILTVSSAGDGKAADAFFGKKAEEAAEARQNTAGLAAFHALDPAVQALFTYPDSLNPAEPYVRDYLERQLEKQQKILMRQKQGAAAETEEMNRTRALVRRLKKLSEGTGSREIRG